MKQRIHFITKGFILILATLFFQGFSNKPGGDYYRIFLNDKMVVEQFLTMPKVLKALPLSAANPGDQLRIQYSHCGMAGKSRSLSLKDEKGKLLKEWKFPDTKSTDMQLAVKEVVNASGKSNTSSIYYTSK